MCTLETENLLLAVLVFNLFLSLRDISLPIWHTIAKHMSEHRQELLSATRCSLDNEIELDEYEGVLFDYAQVAVTFGYIAWFASACPGSSIVAFCIAIVQIRVDAYKLCYLTQRPFPLPADSIGGWYIYLKILARGSVVVNAMNVIVIRALASQAEMADIPMDNWLHHLYLLTMTMVIFYVLSLIAGIFDSTDRNTLRYVKSIQKRQEFLQNKYIYLLADKNQEHAATQQCEPGNIFLNSKQYFTSI